MVLLAKQHLRKLMRRLSVRSHVQHPIPESIVLTLSPPSSRMPQPQKQPLIPEKYLDAPSQRLYYLSLGLLCQVCISLYDDFSCSQKHSLAHRQSNSSIFLFHWHLRVKDSRFVPSGSSLISCIASFSPNFEYRASITAKQVFCSKYVYYGFWMGSCLGE
jgi:hypothetical protein